MIVCLDTMVLVWGVMAHSVPGWLAGQRGRESYDKLRSDAIALRDFIAEFREDDFLEFVIPSPVIAEYGAWFRDEKLRLEQVELVKEFASVVPFNESAAERCSDLVVEWTEANGCFPSGSKAKAWVKTDLMIAAIADLNRCDKIITDNTSDFDSVAESIYPEVTPLDELPERAQIGLL